MGEFGWVDWVGFAQAFAGYVAGVEEVAGEVGNKDILDFGFFDVCEENSFGAGCR